MLKQNDFIKKYIRLHPSVTKTYARKKYKKARSLFGTTNKRDHESSDSDDSPDEQHHKKMRYKYHSDEDDEDESINLEKLLRDQNINVGIFNKFVELQNELDFDKDNYDQLIHNYITLLKVLKENSINNPNDFLDYVETESVNLYMDEYDDIVKEYVELLENGEISPLSPLSADQREDIRQHPKCKLYKWMERIAPNDQIPKDVNILTDSECRYYYMHQGLHYIITTIMIEKLLSLGDSWTDVIYPKSFVSGCCNGNNDLIDFIENSDAIFAACAFPVGYPVSSTNTNLSNMNTHQYLLIKLSSSGNKTKIIIVNPHGITDESEQKSLIFYIQNRVLTPELFNKCKFQFFNRHFSDQTYEGSCVSHVFTRMIYVAYRLKNKDHTIDNIINYVKKVNIPCPFAVFTQNLKYLAEEEIIQKGTELINLPGFTEKGKAKYRRFETLQDTLDRINFNIIKDQNQKNVNKILTFRTNNDELNELIRKFRIRHIFRPEEKTNKFEKGFENLMNYKQEVDDILQQLQQEQTN
jgi:hypothetical protein